MRTQVIKNAFSTGEISPYALGRTDLEEYKNACESLQNFIVLIAGGLTRRPGTRFICNAMGPSRLVAFEFSSSQAYVLEFGNQKLRFYTLGGQIQSGGNPYQISTPYDTSVDNLWDLKFAQFGDIMYIAHPNHPVMKLNRLGDANWVLVQPTFHPPPLHAFDEDIGSPNADHAGAITLTPGATSGSGVTFTASAGIFIDADVGKAIISGTGTAFITAVGGTTSTDPNTGATLHTTATADIIDNFASTSAIAAGQWLLRGPPQSYACYGNVDGGGNFFSTNKLGTGQLQTLFTFKRFPVNAGAAHYQDTLRLVDQGRYIVIGGSVGQIITVTNANQASVRVLSPIVDTQPNPNGSNAIIMQPQAGGNWDLENPSFSAANGYPRAVAFFQDRLCFAGTLAQPQNIWFSVTGDYENFAKGTEDDSGIDIEINSGQREQIQWLAAYQGQLAAGTLRTEYVVSGGALALGGNGPAITPTNVSASIQSRFGVSPIQPLFVENDLIYVQRARLSAYQFSYDIYRSVYGSRNLNILADLITTSGFKEMTYQEMPFRVVWFVTEDGNLVGLTYHRPEPGLNAPAFAWHRHFTGQDLATPDQYVSCAAIPHSDGLSDDLWFCTARQVNGATVYFIELADPSLYVDAGSQATFAPTTSVGGMSYLQGRSAILNNDGAAVGPFTVPAGGTLSFIEPARNIQVGLPFTSKMLSVRPEIPGGQTIQGLTKRNVWVWARLYNSVGLAINGHEVHFRTPSMDLGQGVPPFTGDVRVENLGYDRDARILVQQTQPLPCNLLSLFGSITIGEQ